MKPRTPRFAHRPRFPFHGGVRVLLCATLLALAGCREQAAPTAPVAAAPEPLAAPSCVYFKQLSAFLPSELVGFRLNKDEGSTGKYGEVLVSEAERLFVHPTGGHVSVRIVDTSLSKRLGTAIRAAADEASSREATDPTAPILTGDAVGFVRYDPEDAKAEANLLVGGRFVVAVSSVGFRGTTEVRRVTRALDLAGLSKLR